MALISLRDYILPQPISEQVLEALNLPSYNVPLVVPVVFGILTPVAFASSGLFGKYLAQDRIGFDITNLSFNAQYVVNFILFIALIAYTFINGFNGTMFIYGIGSGVAESLAKVLI